MLRARSSGRCRVPPRSRSALANSTLWPPNAALSSGRDASSDRCAASRLPRIPCTSPMVISDRPIRPSAGGRTRRRRARACSACARAGSTRARLVSMRATASSRSASVRPAHPPQSPCRRSPRRTLEGASRAVSVAPSPASRIGRLPEDGDEEGLDALGARAASASARWAARRASCAPRATARDRQAAPRRRPLALPPAGGGGA